VSSEDAPGDADTVGGYPNRRFSASFIKERVARLTGRRSRVFVTVEDKHTVVVEAQPRWTDMEQQALQEDLQGLAPVGVRIEVRV